MIKKLSAIALKGYAVMAFLCFAAVLPQPAHSADYYVDNGNPAASDSGPGTEDQPWEHCPGGSSTV